MRIKNGSMKIMDKNEKLDIIDGLISEWKMKIHDLKFSIESMEEFKKKLLE